MGCKAQILAIAMLWRGFACAAARQNPQMPAAQGGVAELP